MKPAETKDEASQPFLPLSRPSVEEGDVEAVAAVLRSGWITTGPKCAELEEGFRQRLGCAHALTVAHATAGMHLLLHALDVGPGDEVITPSLTWVSTANLIVLRGATPVFVDVDRETLMTDAALVEARLSERTRAVVPVHFAGAPADLAPLRELATARGLALIEDAAHALGTRHHDEPIGARGTSVFSFHPIKNLTTGEGGMICTDEGALADRLRRLRFHGLAQDTHERETQGRAPQAEVVEPGYKYNLPDMNAALGLGQLERLERTNARRRELAELYLEELAGVDELRPLARPAAGHRHSWHLFVVRLDLERSGMDRATFMAGLRERGIGTGIHFRAIHEQAWYRERFPAQDLPATEWNSERILSLPLFPAMRADDVRRVVEASKALLARRAA